MESSYTMNLEDDRILRDYSKLKERIIVTITLSRYYNRMMGQMTHFGPRLTPSNPLGPFGTRQINRLSHVGAIFPPYKNHPHFLIPAS